VHQLAPRGNNSVLIKLLGIAAKVVTVLT
jgi:hypothetical protein